jgi:hypothetical protein
MQKRVITSDLSQKKCLREPLSVRLLDIRPVITYTQALIYKPHSRHELRSHDSLG